MIRAEKQHGFGNFCFVAVRKLSQNLVDSGLQRRMVQVTGGLASCRNILSDIIKLVGNCRDILVQVLTFVTPIICIKPNYTAIIQAKKNTQRRPFHYYLGVPSCAPQWTGRLPAPCFSLKENHHPLSRSCWGREWVKSHMDRMFYLGLCSTKCSVHCCALIDIFSCCNKSFGPYYVIRILPHQRQTNEQSHVHSLVTSMLRVQWMV